MRRRRGLNFARKRRNMSAYVVKEVCSWLLHIMVAVLMALILVFCVGMRTSVIGVSMEKALYSGQQVLVNRLSYLFFGPAEGDIIVFTPNGNRNTHFYIKRVVAVPGDSVCIKDGKLYVNNTIVDYGYDKIFTRQLQAQGVAGDVFFGISTSGNSKNIVDALPICKEKGITTIALTGMKSCKMDDFDIVIKVPSAETPRIQECQTLIGHIICCIVEENIFGEEYNK